jgi:hypothetical protein
VTRLRRLNGLGLERMGAFLDSLPTDAPQPYPQSLLSDDESSEALGVKIDVERKGFLRRFELAAYVFDKFHDSGMDHPERDAGLWAWLALYWFDQLCPADKQGRRRPKARARWIPDLDNARRYYRHLVLGPYLIYLAHYKNPKITMGLLGTDVNAPGDIVEQFASRPQLVTCPAAVAAVTKLYWRPQGGFKPRAAGGDDSPGTARRLALVLMQFDRTFDLHSLSSDQLLTLLPAEFNSFRS